MTEPDKNELWYQTSLDVFLNRWFSSYDAARAALKEQGGFLLPYRHHFYICKPEVVSALGLDPGDPDWEKIGFDCVRPSDPEAFQRLRQKRESVVNAGDAA